MSEQVPNAAYEDAEGQTGSAEVTMILQTVPEFADRYLGLVEDADGHPGANEAFSELADYVSELASRLEQFQPLLARCLSAVEQVATASEDAEELVGWCFLDYLPPDARRAVMPWLGPCTISILETIENP
jgi:hypothetical protein